MLAPFTRYRHDSEHAVKRIRKFRHQSTFMALESKKPLMGLMTSIFGMWDDGG